MGNSFESIVIDTDKLLAPVEGDNLHISRKNIYDGRLSELNPTVSIFVLGYNRLSKTKKCVECVLKYTADISFELILIDNGSTDATYDYFQSVEFKKKKIIKITKNIGSIYALQVAMSIFNGKYFVLIPNDAYVTKNWLSNMLNCMESDPKIGFVTPVSSNISNLQQVDLSFNGYDDMQDKAAIYNQSDPLKWEERLRLINIVTVLRKEVIDNVGFFDAGFFHDFGEDDYSIRIRRTGYKLVLCRDTYVYHDHDFRNYEDKDMDKFNQSLTAGRKNYNDKYYGLDAWNDINNYESNLINMFPYVKKESSITSILGIDIKCGTPILEIRNRLRKFGILSTTSAAFTTQAKYYQDLLFVTDGNVKCDRIDFLNEHFLNESFDYIVLGDPINTYSQPISLMGKLLDLAAPGAKILLKLRNTQDIRIFLRILGQDQIPDQDMPIHLSLEDFTECLKLMGIKNQSVLCQQQNVVKSNIESVMQIIESMGLNVPVAEIVNKLFTTDFLFCIEK